MTDWTRDTQKQSDWHRPNFQAWRDGLSPERRAADEAFLQKIFDQAENSATLKAALDWARANDVVFYVDHTTIAGGHYHSGTGIAAVSKRSFSGVETLVHEIRHAWQDAHGLLDSPDLPNGRHQRLGGRMIRLALYEADAYAHGKLAVKEVSASKNIERLQTQKRDLVDKEAFLIAMRELCFKQDDLTANRDSHLRHLFINWFFNSSMSNIYGSTLCKDFASALEIPGSKPVDHRIEFSEVEMHTGNVDPWRYEDILKFGKAFGGGNYLAGLDRALLMKTILSLESAENLYKRAGPKVTPAAQEIRRQQLRIKMGRA